MTNETTGNCGAINNMINTIKFSISSGIVESTGNINQHERRRKFEPVLKSTLMNSIIPVTLGCSSCPLNNKCRVSPKENLKYIIGVDTIGLKQQTIDLTVNLV